MTLTPPKSLVTRIDSLDRASAAATWSRLVREGPAADHFRSALMAVPPDARDAWLDLVFALDVAPDDGPALPLGCVPYLPCGVETLLRVVSAAEIRGDDVFVDVGSGLGRAAALVHLLTGAEAIGLEIQPHLARASRDLSTRLGLSRLSVVEGDAAQLADFITTGSVFFLYCPFSGARLSKVLDALEPIARSRPIRVCCVDLPLPPRPWLELAAPPSHDLAVWRSTLLDGAP